MTEQEIFTKAYEVLRERGFTRAGVSSVDDHFTCQYRSPVGPCALGIFMTDEEYDPKFDEDAIPGAMIVKNDWLKAIPPYLAQFADELQSAHDLGRTPEQMHTRLHELALKYNLEVLA